MSTDDSRLRLYQMETFSQICKFKGLRNETLQISASFRCVRCGAARRALLCCRPHLTHTYPPPLTHYSSDGQYVICGSETGHVYIWNTSSINSNPSAAGDGELGSKFEGGLGQGLGLALGLAFGFYTYVMSRWEPLPVF